MACMMVWVGGGSMNGMTKALQKRLCQSAIVANFRQDLLIRFTFRADPIDIW
jgi:hypothetical protein